MRWLFFLERYRSGHNEAVLKTVCPQGHKGSNPFLSGLILLRINITKINLKFLSLFVDIMLTEWYNEKADVEKYSASTMI